MFTAHIFSIIFSDKLSNVGLKEPVPAEKVKFSLGINWYEEHLVYADLQETFKDFIHSCCKPNPNLFTHGEQLELFSETP